jgi:hypothetical protein
MVIYVNVDNCRLGFCTVYVAVAGFVILASAYLTFYSHLYAYMCILSTVIIELILGIFTSFMMALGYCIISWFTAL